MGIYIYAYTWYLYCKYVYIYIHEPIYIHILYICVKQSTSFLQGLQFQRHLLVLSTFWSYSKKSQRDQEISISTSLKVVTGRKFISFVDVHKKCFTNKYDKIRPLTPDPSTFRQDSPCTSWIDGQRSFWEVYPRPFVCLLVFLQNLRLKTSHVLKQGRSFGWSTVYPGYIDIFE